MRWEGIVPIQWHNTYLSNFRFSVRNLTYSDVRTVTYIMYLTYVIYFKKNKKTTMIFS